MQIGSYEVPENRLETAIQDVKKVYDAVGMEATNSSDLGGIWGYKNYSTGIFYRRLSSILAYGLLSQMGKGKFQVTKLGQSLSYPESTEIGQKSKHEAVLNVSLWREIHQKHGKDISENSFWVQLKNITDIEPPKAQKLEKQIRRWYMDDMGFVLDTYNKESIDKTQSLRSSSTKDKQMSTVTTVQDMPLDAVGRVQLSEGGFIDVMDETTLTIAKSYLDVFEKKIKEKQSTGSIDDIEPDTGNINGEEDPSNEPDN